MYVRRGGKFEDRGFQVSAGQEDGQFGVVDFQVGVGQEDG